MEEFIKYVDIHNFKSIAYLKLKDCRRINLFIGYPNVGKSNVLEALGLFSLPFLKIKFNNNLNRLVRAENKNEFLHNVKDYCSFVNTNLENINFRTDGHGIEVIISREKKKLFFEFCNDLFLIPKSDSATNNRGVISNYCIYDMDSGGIRIEKDTNTDDVKRYIFQTKNEWKSTGDGQLLPPYGENIIDTLSYNENVSEVKQWMKGEFSKFGLEYVLDQSSNSLKVQKRLGGDEVMQLPYSSIADTLQRVIFYKTAIASNKNSVLLFEEPEAHAFPPYISTITQDIAEAKTNQFFIATHSPIVINDFLEYEHLRSETSIYLFDFKNDQTTVKRLSDEEMELVYEYGNDLFFNLENLL